MNTLCIHSQRTVTEKILGKKYAMHIQTNINVLLRTDEVTLVAMDTTRVMLVLTTKSIYDAVDQHVSLL